MDKLQLYNGALLFLGEDNLDTLTDNVETRRLLDSVYDRGGLKYVLEQGLWNFAMRSSKLEPSPSVTTPFGQKNAFEKPTDYVRTASISSDGYFRTPLLNILDERAYWYADIDELYVQYVSKDTAYGFDYSLWPETFSRYAEAYFGQQIHRRLTQNKRSKDEVDKDVLRLLRDARSKDAIKNPTTFFPSGRWTSSRGSSSNDLGSRSRLIG